MLPFSIEYYPPDVKGFPLFRLAERYGTQPHYLVVVLDNEAPADDMLGQASARK